MIHAQWLPPAKSEELKSHILKKETKPLEIKTSSHASLSLFLPTLIFKAYFKVLETLVVLAS